MKSTYLNTLCWFYSRS